jgi:signal transduction histidine kinase
VKKIVEEHQGSIQVDNLKTGGASIRIALPAYQSERIHSDPPVERIERERAA